MSNSIFFSFSLDVLIYITICSFRLIFYGFDIIFVKHDVALISNVMLLATFNDSMSLHPRVGIGIPKIPGNTEVLSSKNASLWPPLGQIS